MFPQVTLCETTNEYPLFPPLYQQSSLPLKNQFTVSPPKLPGLSQPMQISSFQFLYSCSNIKSQSQWRIFIVICHRLVEKIFTFGFMNFLHCTSRSISSPSVAPVNNPYLLFGLSLYEYHPDTIKLLDSSVLNTLILIFFAIMNEFRRGSIIHFCFLFRIAEPFNFPQQNYIFKNNKFIFQFQKNKCFLYHS